MYKVLSVAYDGYMNTLTFGSVAVGAPGSIARKRSEFRDAYKAIPTCLVGYFTDTPKTIFDLKMAAEHEVDMFNENQDGALTSREISQVIKYLSKLRTL
jgi:hypothetical protein